MGDDLSIPSLHPFKPSSLPIYFLFITETIMQTPMSKKPPPTLERYDGSVDPDNHLGNFTNVMAFYTDNDP